MKKMNKFCPAPWITISTDNNGSIRPCCRYKQYDKQTEYKMPFMYDGDINDLYNGDQMKALRQAFLDGKQPKECEICWNEENVGVYSFREKYIDRNYEYDLDNPTPQILDLKLSNVCNLKCRMCGPWASSLIAKEQGVQEDYWTANKIIGTDQEKTFFNDWLPNMKELELTGGEPFFSNENKKLLEKIIDSGYAKNIRLLLTTNGMFYIPSLMEKIKKFKKVQIALSVDDMGPRLEYARKNSKWETIKNNIITMVNNYIVPEKFEIGIYRTVNNFNIFYLEDLDNFATEHNIYISNGILHDPSSLSIKNLPTHVKEIVTQKYSKLNHNNYDHILQFMQEEIIDHRDMISEYHIKDLDDMRNESFQDVFPEWNHILNE